MALYLGSNEVNVFSGNTSIPSGYIRPSGTYNINSNGEYDITNYANVEVDVAATIEPTIESLTITPTETQQIFNGVVDGYKPVTVDAVSSTYVGSQIERRDATDLTVNSGTIIVPAGYYDEQVSKTVANGSLGTPVATKGTVSNHSISITPSVTNTTGYVTGGTKTGTSVSVSASELVSGNLAITSNGTGINVANYSTVSVDVVSNPNIETLSQTINSNVTSISYTVKGQPKAFFLQLGNVLGTVYSVVLCISYNGTTTTGLFNPSSTTCYYNTAIFSFTYSGTTLTINVGKFGSDQIYFYGRYGGTYILTYVY